ncbi:hypothetical protein O3M35_010510 [Rhynocoris fuscipes]|uniref:Methionyl-tRNA formyltransferase, mitochondrial n=1 Tax=Rhynocoris fuscipes TaxID=488301 RepID=A0AAW1D056_9HEMI
MKVFLIFSKVLNNSCSLLFKKFYSVESKCTKVSLYKGPPWRILFFGTDDFALHSLKALCAKLRTGTLIESLGIVTKKGTLVEKFGEDENLPSFVWPIKPVDIENKYDIGMVVSFGKMITNDVIMSFPLGCVNVHASMLPRWRGAAPIIHAVMNGDTETGITIMRIHPHKFDVGEIVRQYRIPIENDETASELEIKLGKYGAHLLMDCVRDLPRCVQKAIPQPNEGVTYAPKIKSEMAIVYWDKMSAIKLYNMHRALNHLYPLTTKWHGRKVKFTEISIDKENFNTNRIRRNDTKQDSDSRKSALAFLNSNTENTSESLKSFSFNDVNNEAGVIVFDKKSKNLNVKCCDGNNIVVKRLKHLGKSMSALDFYNGFVNKRPKDEWRFGS